MEASFGSYHLWLCTVVSSKAYSYSQCNELLSIIAELYSFCALKAVWYCSAVDCSALDSSGLDCTSAPMSLLTALLGSPPPLRGSEYEAQPPDTCGGIIRMIRRIRMACMEIIKEASIVTVMGTTVIHGTRFQMKTWNELVQKSLSYDCIISGRKWIPKTEWSLLLLLLLSSRTSQTPMTIYEVWHQQCRLEIWTQKHNHDVNEEQGSSYYNNN